MAKRRRCEPLDEYCKRERISYTQLAERLQFEETTTRSLVNGSRPITGERAVQIENRIGIPRETLRPDLFIRRAA